MRCLSSYASKSQLSLTALNAIPPLRWLSRRSLLCFNLKKNRIQSINLCAFLVLAVGGLLSLSSFQPSRADELRIAPEDRQLQAAISRRLSPPLRVRLKDLASTTPRDLLQDTQKVKDVLQSHFSSSSWTAEELRLITYYFLVAHLEHDRKTSMEFQRRRIETQQGRDLMRQYLDDVHRALVSTVASSPQVIDLGPLKEFPLSSVGWMDEAKDKKLNVLRSYPEVRTSLGIKNLRYLQQEGLKDLNLLDAYLDKIDSAERAFLQEASLVGDQLLAMRAEVAHQVQRRRAGLPFSF